ncbi:MAG: hypothetical protein ABIR94_20705 [Rubrivivax sp.]
MKEAAPDPVVSMLAHNMHVHVLLFSGDPAAAMQQVENSLPLYDPRAHRALAIEYGEAPRWPAGCWATRSARDTVYNWAWTLHAPWDTPSAERRCCGWTR